MNTNQRNLVSQKLLALSARLSDLSNKIMRDPRTKNVLGFAMIGVLAAVVFSMAQNPGDKVTLAKMVQINYTKTNGEKGFGGTFPGHKVSLISDNGDTVTVAFSDSIATLPKSLIVEFGGVLGKGPEDREAMNREKYTTEGKLKPKVTPWTGYVHQEPQPGQAPIEPTGFTPELLAQLNKMLGEPYHVHHLDAILAEGGLWKAAPLSQTLSEYIASGKPVTEEQKWKFSLRPQFDQYNIDVKKDTDRTDISCSPKAFQDALELLWSQKEGKPVKLSSSFLRWAHDQVMGKLHPVYQTDTDPNYIIRGIQRYGICRRDLMDNSQTTPSAEALADAATRKQLVLRTVALGQWTDPTFKNFEVTPVEELVISELQKGRPILVSGTGLIPSPKYHNWTILDYRPNSFAGRPPQLCEGQFEWPNTVGGSGGHSHLITGYFLTGDNGNDGCQLIQSIPKELKRHSGTGKAKGYNNYQYMWEFREGMGTDLGDRGYVFTTNDTIRGLRNRMVSLALE